MSCLSLNARLAGHGLYLVWYSKQCHTYCKIRNLIRERQECGRLLKLVVRHRSNMLALVILASVNKIYVYIFH